MSVTAQRSRWLACAIGLIALSACADTASGRDLGVDASGADAYAPPDAADEAADSPAADADSSAPNPPPDDERCPTPGQRQCDGVCVDVSHDDHNCGVCGAYCPSTEHCLAGRCQVVDCAELPLAMCGDECVDTRIDPRHCGGCGAACDRGEICADGVCECAGGIQRCGDDCVSLVSDARHCGACGMACGLNDRCMEGVCVTCEPPSMWCGAVCVPSDRLHCGACDRECPTGVPCMEGACRCEEPLSVCGSGCASLADDPVHCGRCGSHVPTNAECLAGEIVCQPGYRSCGLEAGPSTICVEDQPTDVCDPCDGGAACGEGRYCMRSGCFAAETAGLEVDCGGPYPAGSGPEQCHAYLDLRPAGRVEITRSPYLTWSVRRCTGSACEDATGNAPMLVEGPGDLPGTGVVTPAGASRPALIDEEISFQVRAVYSRGDEYRDNWRTVLTLRAPD